MKVILPDTTGVNKLINIAEFQVWGPYPYYSPPSLMLLSQNKAVEQSTNYVSYEPNHPTTYASHAVDGDLTTFSVTAWQLNPWLQVDLGAMYTITSISVINRQDCCQDRFNNATYIVLDEDETEVASESVSGQIGYNTAVQIGTSLLSSHTLCTPVFSKLI